MNEDILNSYRHATKRLFLLDYDGTIMEIKQQPLDAFPTPEILGLLEKLAGNPQNTIVIVSGRRHEELEDWLGKLPISFAAEHGLLAKKAGGTWEATADFSTAWKTEVLPVMERYYAEIPGSLIEDKTSGLVWHYRTAEDTTKAEEAQAKLFDELQPICERLQLKLMRGSKIIEVLPLGFNKGAAIKYYLGQDNWDFVLIAGDDTTDEDMFKAAPDSALTVKIGEGETAARLHINSPAEMRGLLDKLAVS